MTQHQAQSARGAWVAAEANQDSLQWMQRLAAEYEKLAAATAARAVKWDGLAPQVPRSRTEKTD